MGELTQDELRYCIDVWACAALRAKNKHEFVGALKKIRTLVGRRSECSPPERKSEAAVQDVAEALKPDEQENRPDVNGAAP